MSPTATRRATYAAQAEACIAGKRDADQLIALIVQQVAPPNAVYQQLQAVLSTAEPVRVAAWCRVLQKRLESHCNER